VQLCLERALEEARAADRALAHGEVRGPLHGVPITIKDNLDTAGIVSTGGTKGRKGFVPKYDATVVARLRGAGAILLGKTNTPELTMAYETTISFMGGPIIHTTNHALAAVAAEEQQLFLRPAEPRLMWEAILGEAFRCLPIFAESPESNRAPASSCRNIRDGVAMRNQV
jgi:hypothetical protein